MTATLAGGPDFLYRRCSPLPRVALGYRVLDISTGTGEAALMTLPIVGASGLVIGADISPAMVEAARDRSNESSFWPVAADVTHFRSGMVVSMLSPANSACNSSRTLRWG